jgi:hypothetical protein
MLLGKGMQTIHFIEQPHRRPALKSHPGDFLFKPPVMGLYGFPRRPFSFE